MGKTALAVYMRHKINHGFGNRYFNGGEKFFCSYVSFSNQIKSRIAFLYKEGFRALIRDGIFMQVSQTVSKQDLLNAGVQEDFAEAIVTDNVRQFLEQRSKYSLNEMSSAYDQKFLAKLPDLFMTQTVKALKAAGFKGGILVIDDMENLTDKSTRAEIENFIKDFGLAFFRAGNEASNDKFFTLIITAHQQSAQKISQAWTVAGLSASFPLTTGGGASLLTRRPDKDQSTDIVVQHLKFYRLPSAKVPNEYFPFTKEAIETVVTECEFHPRRFLSRFNRIVSEALGSNAQEIPKDFVEKVPEVEIEETVPGIEEL